MKDLPLAAKICNCAMCKQELMGLNNPPGWIKAGWRPLIFKRINDRPYCIDCCRKIMTGLEKLEKARCQNIS